MNDLAAHAVMRARLGKLRRLELRAVEAFEALWHETVDFVGDGLAVWAKLEAERDHLVRDLWRRLGMTDEIESLVDRLSRLEADDGDIAHLVSKARARLGLTEDPLRWDAADVLVSRARDELRLALVAQTGLRNRRVGLADAREVLHRAALSRALGPALLLVPLIGGDDHGAGSRIELLEEELEELRRAALTVTLRHCECSENTPEPAQ